VHSFSSCSYPWPNFGYLTAESDGKTITVTLKTSDASGVKLLDSVTVDIKSGKIKKTEAE
jgi:hypothetical protein